MSGMTKPCEACGRTGKRHAGHGLCMGCYKRKRRREDPAYGEADRQASRRWKDAHREQNRARDRARARRDDIRGSCDVCGGLMGIGQRQNGTCADCRAELHELRWQRIEAMWAAGDSILAIADALGVAKGTVQGEIALMREAGRAVPYRYKNTKLQRAAA